MDIKERTEMIQRFVGITENSIMPNFDRIPQETWDSIYEPETALNSSDSDTERYFTERNILKNYITQLETIICMIEEKLLETNPEKVGLKRLMNTDHYYKAYFKTAIEALLGKHI